MSRPDRRGAASALLAFASFALTTMPGPRLARADSEKSIYHVDPLIDGAVIGASVYRSFYSGHVALVTTALSTAAVTIGERHGPALAAWLVMAGVSASVAAERVAAGWHFPTDVIAAAAAGTAVGVVVPALHLRRLRLVPTTISGAVGPTEGLMVAGRWP